jgi:hypothetical protein
MYPCLNPWLISPGYRPYSEHSRAGREPLHNYFFSLVCGFPELRIGTHNADRILQEKRKTARSLQLSPEFTASRAFLEE